ncbi:hypothetical protein [Streptomyces sp. NBC_01013]|nr:hypothetical protein OG538_22165 [Streptomyces sp. NBC_01013]
MEPQRPTVTWVGTLSPLSFDAAAGARRRPRVHGAPDAAAPMRRRFSRP